MTKTMVVLDSNLDTILIGRFAFETDPSSGLVYLACIPFSRTPINPRPSMSWYSMMLNTRVHISYGVGKMTRRIVNCSGRQHEQTRDTAGGDVNPQGPHEHLLCIIN